MIRKKEYKKSAKIIVNRKPSLTLLVLKTVGDMGMATLDAFFPAKYPQARMWRGILGLGSSRKFSKKTFATMLSRLQKQGLVTKHANRWSITSFGKKFLGERWFKGKTKSNEPDGVMRLVVFDIPERERKRRLWLRLELLACDYKILQKSVWIGYCPLPEEFFSALDYLNLRDCVHIFSVKSKGTLKEEY